MSCEFRILDFNYAFQSATDITASTEDPSFPASNLKNQIRAFTWRSTSATAQYVVFDIKTTEAIDSVAIVFDPHLGIKLSDAATLKIQASATNVWTAPPVDVTLTIDEESGVATHFFSSDQSYRYWRVYIDDPVSAYGYIEIPKVILAKATQLTQGPAPGFQYDVVDQSKKSANEYGQQYWDVYPSKQAMDFDFSVLTYADIETLIDVYDVTGNVRAVAVSLDSTETLFDKDRFFIYGHFKGSLSSKHRAFSYFDTGFGVEEAF